jgi:hypothetical protein
VRANTVRTDGKPEGFLFAGRFSRCSVPITRNAALVRYLHENPGYRIAQHGYHHTMNEFETEKSEEICERLEQGAHVLETAGFARPATFVAPYDKYSRTSIQEVARRFRVFSTGWFELRRIPQTWWFFYAWKKIMGRPHWRMGETLLLSHPGCLLSYHRPSAEMLGMIKNVIARQQLTVLVTHWWEYFRNGQPDEPFVRVLHETAAWLADQPDVRVISFDDIAHRAVRLN